MTKTWTAVICAVAVFSLAACSAECEQGKVEIENHVCVSEGVAPGYTGPTCSEDSASGGRGPNAFCEMAWVCGSDLLALACEPAGTGYLCHCNENAISLFDFFSPNACADVTDAFRGETAASNCNWPVAWTW